MDASTSGIADYPSTLAYADLPAEVVHECKRRLVETVGCTRGAFDDEPSLEAQTISTGSGECADPAKCHDNNVGGTAKLLQAYALWAISMPQEPIPMATSASCIADAPSGWRRKICTKRAIDSERRQCPHISTATPRAAPWQHPYHKATAADLFAPLRCQPGTIPRL
jgi:hypothetical protein